MIEIVGFWTSVTMMIGLPLWFFGYRITRGILSIAKTNAPEIPYRLRKRGAWSRWECQLYPRWAHKLNRMFGGGFVNTGGVLILGVVASIPSSLLFLGAFHPAETVIGIITVLSEAVATMMGWLVVVVSTLSGGYIGISKGSRLIGLIQIQEMKEGGREDR